MIGMAGGTGMRFRVRMGCRLARRPDPPGRDIPRSRWPQTMARLKPSSDSIDRSAKSVVSAGRFGSIAMMPVRARSAGLACRAKLPVERCVMGPDRVGTSIVSIFAGKTRAVDLEQARPRDRPERLSFRLFGGAGQQRLQYPAAILWRKALEQHAGGNLRCGFAHLLELRQHFAGLFQVCHLPLGSLFDPGRREFRQTLLVQTLAGQLQLVGRQNLQSRGERDSARPRSPARRSFPVLIRRRPTPRRCASAQVSVATFRIALAKGSVSSAMVTTGFDPRMTSANIFRSVGLSTSCRLIVKRPESVCESDVVIPDNASLSRTGPGMISTAARGQFCEFVGC